MFANTIDENILDIQKKNKNNNLQNDFYIIGNGDVLSLKLIDAPELSTKLSVLNDGSIQIPIVGNYFVSGKTINQASKEIKNLLAEHLLRPDLYLTIITPRPIKVALIGELESPGLYSMNLNAKNRGSMGIAVTASGGMPTLVDAIQLAGGVTKNADLKNVTILRRLPGDNGDFKKAKVDLIDLILNGNQMNNPFLFDGDTISIKKAEDVSVNTLEIVKANLTPKIIKVNIIGEVTSPGNISLDSGTSLTQAILRAGGPISWRANKGNVRLIRINRNGTLKNKRYKLELSQPPSEKKNPIVINGDTIFVGTGKLGALTDSLQAISKPMSSVVTVWSLLKIIGD